MSNADQEKVMSQAPRSEIKSSVFSHMLLFDSKMPNALVNAILLKSCC